MNEAQKAWTEKEINKMYEKVKGKFMTDEIAEYLVNAVKEIVEKSKHHPEVRERAANFLTELSIKEQKGERL